ncbi:pectin lyase fold/virulence factor [Zopfochytrium polystomum]|nr:pectin lyase fold/virulence factor [Zopfochytrium polystomum]
MPSSPPSVARTSRCALPPLSLPLPPILPSSSSSSPPSSPPSSSSSSTSTKPADVAAFLASPGRASPSKALHGKHKARPVRAETWRDRLVIWAKSDKLTKKPKFFKLTTTGGSLVKGLTMQNSPVYVFGIGRSNATLDRITIDNSAGDQLSGGKTMGHNTDGFDVSGRDITIQNSVVKNQDDCLAVNKGGAIKFLNNKCSGGHGISIGSVDTGNSVDGVDNDVRIKTYGVAVEQDNENGSPTGTPTPGIPISGLTLSNVHGTMAAGAKYSTYILCAACSGFSFTGVNITSKNPSCTGVSKTLDGCS